MPNLQGLCHRSNYEHPRRDTDIWHLTLVIWHLKFMFRIESVVQLKDDETVQALVRRHLATVIPQLALAMALIVAPFFFLFPLFSLGIIGVIVFGVLVVVGILLAVRCMILWDADVMIITTERVIDVDQTGLLSRQVSEAPYSSIQDISWKRKGLWQTIFRMGSVTIQTAGASAPIQADYIAYPASVHELINDLKRQAQVAVSVGNSAASGKDRASRMRHIAQMLEGASNEVIMQVELNLEKLRKNESMKALFSESDKDNP